MRDDMACTVCRAVLNTIGDPPRYLHSIDQPGTPHQPDPVPAHTLDTLRQTCDFCSDPHPIWTRTGAHLSSAITDGRTIRAASNYGDTWAVCATCDLHITHRRPDRVADRTYTALGITPGTEAARAVRNLQAEFLAGLQPGRALITATAWPATPIAAGQVPKVRDRLRDLYRGTDQLSPQTAAIDRAATADSLEQAHLYWVDDDFTDLTATAAGQLPPTPVTAELPPARHGLLIWSHPIGGDLAAASWNTHHDTLTVIGYRTIGGDLSGPALQHLRTQAGWLAPIRGNQPMTTTSTTSPVAALVVSWLLIAQHVTTQTDAPIDKGTVRGYARTGRPAPAVRLLSIRTPRTSDAMDTQPHRLVSGDR